MILVPTPLEKRVLDPLLADAVRACEGAVELCGFGLVAAAASSATRIAQRRPERVVLLGIAGSYGDGVPVGEATRFDAVVCDGLGVGVGDDHVPTSQLGWSMIEPSGREPDARPAIGDRIQLTDGDRALISCCAASANAAEARARARAHPDAVAEDMEGFAVAVSCELADVPLVIIRGVSNVAGDRDHSRWRIEPALRAAAALAIPILQGAPNV